MSLVFRTIFSKNEALLLSNPLLYPGYRNPDASAAFLKLYRKTGLFLSLRPETAVPRFPERGPDPPGTALSRGSSHFPFGRTGRSASRFRPDGSTSNRIPGSRSCTSRPLPDRTRPPGRSGPGSWCGSHSSGSKSRCEDPRNPHRTARSDR